jgi:hypothetical protein
MRSASVLAPTALSLKRSRVGCKTLTPQATRHLRLKYATEDGNASILAEVKNMI